MTRLKLISLVFFNFTLDFWIKQTGKLYFFIDNVLATRSGPLKYYPQLSKFELATRIPTDE